MSHLPTKGSYPQLGEYWKELLGMRVRRISIDAGLGCPNRAEGGCIFCSPVTFAPSSGDPRTVTEQIRAAMGRLSAKYGSSLYAAYFQPGTNTWAPIEKLSALWREATDFEEVVSLCVGTRPDCVPDEVLNLLASYKDSHDLWLELGLQSANDDTLKLIGRGHDTAQFADAVRRAHALGIQTCAHVILGLPGEDENDEQRTAALLAELGVKGIKLHQLEVNPDTPLAELWQKGEVPTLTEEEYVERAVSFIRALPPATILHRMVGGTLKDHPTLAPSFNRHRVLNRMRTLLGKQ